MAVREARQLVLGIAPPPAFGEEDFLPSSCNEAALAAVDAWPDWPDPALLLIGPRGAGKSHLAAIWAERAQAVAIAAANLRVDDRLANLGDRPVLLEDAEGVTDEAAFFHLLNLVGERGSSLLVTARSAPEHWGFHLRDLLSRLRRAPAVEIRSPDDGLVRAVLVKLLLDRQLSPDEGTVEFVARRIERSLDAARRFVSRLDDEALSTGRRISRSLASDVLKRLEREAAENAP